ncbi:hypothetical protein PUND_a0576 [Pseudoalteromonas undina]|nr:hypothetical protein PUND_a0576 [Pseudoalteromonas undina]
MHLAALLALFVTFIVINSIVTRSFDFTIAITLKKLIP